MGNNASVLDDIVQGSNFDREEGMSNHHPPPLKTSLTPSTRLDTQWIACGNGS